MCPLVLYAFVDEWDSPRLRTLGCFWSQEITCWPRLYSAVCGRTNQTVAIEFVCHGLLRYQYQKRALLKCRLVGRRQNTWERRASAWSLRKATIGYNWYFGLGENGVYLQIHRVTGKWWTTFLWYPFFQTNPCILHTLPYLRWYLVARHAQIASGWFNNFLQMPSYKCGDDQNGHRLTITVATSKKIETSYEGFHKWRYSQSSSISRWDFPL